jgi:hypothetical protein
MTHTITTIDPVKVGPQQQKKRQTWHQVTCSCGWTRKYVSQYTAKCMHTRHAQEGPTR